MHNTLSRGNAPIDGIADVNEPDEVHVMIVNPLKDPFVHVKRAASSYTHTYIHIRAHTHTHITQIDPVLNMPKTVCMMLTPEAKGVAVDGAVGEIACYALNTPRICRRQITPEMRDGAVCCERASERASIALGKPKNNIS